MKKIYYQPECLTVQLGTCTMMAESLPVGGSDDEVTDPDEILTKESRNVNVWDKEW